MGEGRLVVGWRLVVGVCRVLRSVRKHVGPTALVWRETGVVRGGCSEGWL